MAGDGRPWTPSAAQMRFLEAALEMGYQIGNRALCKRADVPERTFYNWMGRGAGSDPGFQEAFGNLWRDVLKRDVPEVVSAMVDKAKRGDVPAGRFVMELAGEYVPKQEQKHSMSLAELVQASMETTAAVSVKPHNPTPSRDTEQEQQEDVAEPVRGDVRITELAGEPAEDSEPLF